jgi:hypothetical protein
MVPTMIREFRDAILDLDTKIMEKQCLLWDDEFFTES